MLKVLIDYFLGEWSFIAQSPAIIVVTFIIGSSLAWAVLGLIYRNRLEDYQSRIDTLEGRIKAKDEQVSTQEKVIQEYKEALSSQKPKPSDSQAPAPPTAQISLKDYTRADLARVAESIAVDIRKLVDERKKIKDRTEEEIIQNDLAYGYEFAQKFQGLAISVRREICSRVKPSDDFLREGYYATATLLSEIESVAEDLEKLAKRVTTY